MRTAYTCLTKDPWIYERWANEWTNQGRNNKKRMNEWRNDWRNERDRQTKTTQNAPSYKENVHAEMIRSLLTYVMSNTNSPGQSQTALGKAPLGSSSEPSPASEWIHRWIPSLKALNVYFHLLGSIPVPQKAGPFWLQHEVKTRLAWN